MGVICRLIVLALLIGSAARAEDGFQSNGPVGEQSRAWSAYGARGVINLPGDFDAKKPTLLIIYACPNGNSVEWTLGAKLESGMDWHYDIQHIAAQVRKLRQVERERNIALACIEAEGRSWPAWRKARPDHGAVIRRMVNDLSRSVPGPEALKRIALTGHSGGGSFIFGYLNGSDTIADDIERIAWIDATYAYDDAERHGDKLLEWLRGDRRRTLVVMAYDDRDVKFNGKNIVSPTGGTYYRSRKMIERIGRDETLVESKRGEFESFTGLDGRIHFLLHTNPQHKILHTVLVERNGLLEAMTLGTPLAGKWGGAFWGERAYTQFITPVSAKMQAATRAATRAATAPAGIPPRPANAIGGRAFIETIADLPPKAREAAIVQEMTRGNVPDFLRQFAQVRVQAERAACVVEVMPDYLAVGSDSDFVRLPMTPQSAAAIADAFGCTLPTRKIVDAIYAQAEVKLEPSPLTEQREAVRTFLQHHEIVESQRGKKPLSALVAGHKKDVVISNRLKEKTNRVAIYGWHKPGGKPIQPLYAGHVDSYVDYSHGIRLVKRIMLVDGEERAIDQVLIDPMLSAILSDEGVIERGASRYEDR